MNNQLVRHHSIQPLNRGTLGTSETWSYKDGSPLIQFRISGGTPRDLLVKSVRLQFEAELVLNASTANNPVPVRNDSRQTGYPGAAGAIDNSQYLTVDSQAGAAAFFEQLVIRNSNGDVLESVDQPARLLTSMIPMTNSQSDMLTTQTTALGYASGNKDVTDAQAMIKTWVSMPIYSGLFLGSKNIPLGPSAFDGLTLDFRLAPGMDCTISKDGGQSGAYVKLTNVRLIYMTAPQAESPDTFNYMSFHAYYNTLSNSESFVRPFASISNCLAMFHTFTTVSKISNYFANGLKREHFQVDNGGGGGAESVIQKSFSTTLANTLAPLQYQQENGLALQNDVRFVPSIIVRNYINSIKHYSRLFTTCVGLSDGGYNGNFSYLTGQVYNMPWLNPPNVADKVPADYRSLSAHDCLECGTAYGNGVSFDLLANGKGVDLNRRPYNARFRTAMNNTVTMGCFSFALAYNQLLFSKRTNGRVIVDY